MTADEILKALEESEGFYLEANGWVVARSGSAPIDSEPGWEMVRYIGCADVDRAEWRETFQEALEYTLKDGKP